MTTIMRLNKYKDYKQTTRILMFIEDVGYITASEAFKLFGITQLAARIFELKTDGYVFTTIRVIPADNGKKWYYEYSLDKDK